MPAEESDGESDSDRSNTVMTDTLSVIVRCDGPTLSIVLGRCTDFIATFDRILTQSGHDSAVQYAIEKSDTHAYEPWTPLTTFFRDEQLTMFAIIKHSHPNQIAERLDSFCSRYEQLQIESSISANGYARRVRECYARTSSYDNDDDFHFAVVNAVSSD
jgi:hypothetical protein